MRYPLGLPRFAPPAFHGAAVVLAAVLLRASPGAGGMLRARLAAAVASPASVAMACAALLALFLPPVVAEPGVPLVSGRGRTAGELLWRAAYLAGALLSASLVALSLGCARWGTAAWSLLSAAALVSAVPFYALPVWTYPVCPLLVGALLW